MIGDIQGMIEQQTLFKTIRRGAEQIPRRKRNRREDAHQHQYMQPDDPREDGFETELHRLSLTR